MKIESVTNMTRQATYDLIFSHMSDYELASFKINSSKAYSQVIDILDGKYGACFIAKQDDQVIGYLLTASEPPRGDTVAYAELREMRVRVAHQRKGIGSQLVQAFIQWARQEGYERLSVDVSALSKKNINFYKSSASPLRRSSWSGGSPDS
jgi:GNAT superfamily N-acetyltransferase